MSYVHRGLCAAFRVAILGLFLTLPGWAEEGDAPIKITPNLKKDSVGQKLMVVDQAQGVSVTQKGRGKLLVVSDTWDFGYIPQNAQVTHRYVLSNAGDDTLFIEQVKPTCGCTSAPLTKDKLAPGEKVPVDVTFSSRTYSGSLTKSVHVISSDAATPTFQLMFTATVGPAPSLGMAGGTDIHFDTFPVSQKKESKLPLVNQSGGTVYMKIADSPSEYLQASLSSETLAPNAQADLVVSTSKAPVGKFNSSVTVDLSGAQKLRVTVPITGFGTTP
jgi:uncharacterized protein DUF1573